MKIPLYAKITVSLVGLFALVAMLYIAQGLIIPLVFALIIAMTLHPVVKIFSRLGINRIVAISITLLVTFLVIAAIGTLLVSQASQFSKSWPSLVDRSVALFNQTTLWASGYFSIDPLTIQEWLVKTKDDFISNGGTTLGQTLLSLSSGMMVLLLVPVYVFLILFYHPLLLEFTHRLFEKSNQNQVKEIITQTKSLIQRYLTGLVIEAALVATLYFITLKLFGIEYALLLAIIGALLNVIPYVGGVVGAALPIMVALATQSTGWYALYVLIAYSTIQMIDNNIIVPKIVASKVKINALCSVIVVIAGSALWGISGMFLSIPLLAIIKLIADHIEPLKPFGFLLGVPIVAAKTESSEKS